jgi:hypothetical protein
VSWWQDLVDKNKDAIAPDPPPPAPPGRDQQQGAPLDPDPTDPHNEGVRDPTNPGGAPGEPPPIQRPFRTSDPDDAGAPPAGSSSIPGGIGTEPNTGAGMTDEVAPAVGTLAAGVAVASGVLAAGALAGAGAGAGAAAGEGGTAIRTIGQLATAEGVLAGAAPPDSAAGSNNQQQPAVPSDQSAPAPAPAPAKADPAPTPSNSQEDSSGGVPATGGSGSTLGDDGSGSSGSAATAATLPADDFALPSPDATPSDDFALPSPDTAPADDFALPSPDSPATDDFALPSPDSPATDDFALPAPDAGPDLPDPDAIGAGPGDPSGMGMG